MDDAPVRGMALRAVMALGVNQCVTWGVLYYAFAVLLVPLEAALGAPRWAVAGAYSLALLVSAAAAPTVGRWSDRGHAPILIQAGGGIAALLLTLWAAFPGLLSTYLAWAGLGACMAATLYEPAFAMVGRAHALPATRLRALALVTLFGGMASTVFLPATAWLVRAWGWRWTVVLLAMTLLAATWLVRRFVVAEAQDREPVPRPVERSSVPAAGEHPRLAFVLVAFGFSSFAASGVIANLVAAGIERQLSPAWAATLGGAFGVMQLPGRALLMHGRVPAPPFTLLAVGLGLQAAGLLIWGTLPGAPALAAGLTTFALGAGLGTLLRPYLVQTMVAGHGAAYINGRVAQLQQVARAAGPVMLAAGAMHLRYATLIALLGLIYVTLTSVALRRGLAPHSAVAPFPGDPQPHADESRRS